MTDEITPPKPRLSSNDVHQVSISLKLADPASIVGMKIALFDHMLERGFIQMATGNGAALTGETIFALFVAKPDSVRTISRILQ